MAVNLSPIGGGAAQFFDNSGNILSGGKIFTYAAGTTTPQASYTSASGATAHANPIILDAAGRVPSGQIWLTADLQYKFLIKTSTDVQIGSYDNINASSYGDASQIAFVGFKNQIGNVQDLADADGSNWIGFEPLGTNAVARSAQDKLRDTVSVKDFGAAGDGVANDTAAFVDANAAVNYASGFNAVNGTYLIDNVELAKANVYGPSVIKPVLGATCLFTLAQDPSTLGSSDWRYRRLVDLYLSGNSKSANGITFKNAAAGRWRIDNCFITACDKGFYKPYGNIANELLTTTINSCNYGYWATSSASPIMHAGNDRIMGGEISNCSLAAIYINSPQSGTGGTVIDKTIIEDNPGFGLFVKNWSSSITPLKLRDVWFENNATSGPVIIDGVSYTPRDIYMENVNYAVIDGSPINKTEFVNSQVLLDNCLFDDTASIINTTSSITIRQANTNGLAKQNVTVESLSNASRATSGFANFFRAVPRANVVYTAPSGTTLYAENFADAGTYTLGGTTSITSTAIADGTLFSNCAEFSIPNGNVNVVGNFTLTSGKFIVYTMDIKQIAATQISVVITGPSAVTASSSAAIFKQDQWVTIGGVAPVILSNTGFYWQLQNTSGSAKTFRLGPVQVIQFDALSDALTYFNSRMVVTG